MIITKLHKKRFLKPLIEVKEIPLSLSTSINSTNGILHSSNGLVYIAPYRSERITVYNPVTDEVSYMSLDLPNQTNKFSDVTEHNGSIWFCPVSYPNLVEINLTTNVKTEHFVKTGNVKYNSINGVGDSLFFTKANEQKWGRWHIPSSTYSEYGLAQVGSNKYVGSHVNGSNNIVAVGFQIKDINILNTNSLTDVLIPNSITASGTQHYYRGCRVGDNWYYTPYDINLDNLLIINHYTNSISYTKNAELDGVFLQTCSQSYKLNENTLLIQQRDGMLFTYNVSTDAFKFLGNIGVTGMHKGCAIGGNEFVFAPLLQNKLVRVKIKNF